MTQSKRWHSAALRIRSSILTVAEISKAMQCSATNSFDKGTPYSQRTHKSNNREESIWILDSGCSETDPLEFHLDQIISFIEVKERDIMNLLNTCSIDVFCGYSSETGQGGFTLNSSLLQRIAKLTIDITFDIYS